MTFFDVAIIGRGASGSTTAFHLANKNKNICILEKNNFTPIRACGGEGCLQQFKTVFLSNLSQLLMR